MMPVLPAHEIVALIWFLAFAYNVLFPSQKKKKHKMRWKEHSKQNKRAKVLSSVPHLVPLVLLWSPLLDKWFLKIVWSSVKRHHMQTLCQTHSKQNYISEFHTLLNSFSSSFWSFRASSSSRRTWCSSPKSRLDFLGSGWSEAPTKMRFYNGFIVISSHYFGVEIIWL